MPAVAIFSGDPASLVIQVRGLHELHTDFRWEEVVFVRENGWFHGAFTEVGSCTSFSKLYGVSWHNS